MLVWIAPRSAGTLSVIGTMFAVVLAFVILFVLQSYQRARDAMGPCVHPSGFNDLGNGRPNVPLW